jgi:hypothetical protein
LIKKNILINQFFFIFIILGISQFDACGLICGDLKYKIRLKASLV